MSVEEFAQLRREGWSYERVARRVEFSITAVARYAQRVLPEELRKAVRPVPALIQDGTEVQGRCWWCGILGDEENPIGEDGRCLWCRVEAQGLRVIDWVEAGGFGLLDG